MYRTTAKRHSRLRTGLPEYAEMEWLPRLLRVGRPRRYGLESRRRDRLSESVTWFTARSICRVRHPDDQFAEILTIEEHIDGRGCLFETVNDRLAMLDSALAHPLDELAGPF